MSLRDTPLTATDALDVERVPDDKIFTLFLDWARVRGLISSYYLVLFRQTGPQQGKPIHISRLKKNTPIKVQKLIHEYVDDYATGGNAPEFIHEHLQDEMYHLYRTSVSRMYDIDLGMLVFTSKHRVREFEVDRFVRFMEANISIRKQSIASKLTPPFVDLALQEPIRLDHEVGRTVVQAIEANQTELLSIDGDRFKTVFSTSSANWSIPADDPIILNLKASSTPSYVQDTSTMTWSEMPSAQSYSGILHRQIAHSGHKSALVFCVKHNADLFAIAICLFARPRAVSMTEVAIASRLQRSLADYYRLGFERHKVRAAAKEASGVEKKAREALLIADIMHDATDDLLAARNSIDSWDPKNDFEANELKNAKMNLKHLQSTAKLFRFLFTASSRQSISVEEALSTGSDYYSEVDIYRLYRNIVSKYESALKFNKIRATIHTPPSLTLSCMEVSVARAIDNCMKNSIRHLSGKTHIKREIKLSAKSYLSDGRAVTELRVWDNGPGIEKDWLTKVHEPFISRSGGMGLGLSIVNTVCEIHSGTMYIESEWGAWTNVSLMFPQQ